MKNLSFQMKYWGKGNTRRNVILDLIDASTHPNIHEEDDDFKRDAVKDWLKRYNFNTVEDKNVLKQVIDKSLSRSEANLYVNQLIGGKTEYHTWYETAQITKVFEPREWETKEWGPIKWIHNDDTINIRMSGNGIITTHKT